MSDFGIVENNFILQIPNPTSQIRYPKSNINNMIEILKKYSFKPIVPFDFQKETIYHIDLTENNPDLKELNLADTVLFSKYVDEKINEAKAVCAIGGYLENRYIYRRSEHFQQNEEPRSIHLGIDIWAAAGTPVFAPLAGKVHSFQNNAGFGDYGPTIILEHYLEENTFYTLYGHLNLECLDSLFEGKSIEAGEKIAEFGEFAVNGDWPPHLHFQVITDMQGKKGDFIGVCEPSKMEAYAKICLDGAYILGTV